MMQSIRGSGDASADHGRGRGRKWRRRPRRLWACSVSKNLWSLKMALYLTEQDVTQLLTMPDTLVAVESVFKAQAIGDATNEPRRRVRAKGATLHVLSGAVAYLGLLGFKAYAVTRKKARFHVT